MAAETEIVVRVLHLVLLAPVSSFLLYLPAVLVQLVLCPPKEMNVPLKVLLPLMFVPKGNLRLTNNLQPS